MYIYLGNHIERIDRIEIENIVLSSVPENHNHCVLLHNGEYLTYLWHGTEESCQRFVTYLYQCLNNSKCINLTTKPYEDANGGLFSE